MNGTDAFLCINTEKICVHLIITLDILIISCEGVVEKQTVTAPEP